MQANRMHKAKRRSGIERGMHERKCNMTLVRTFGVFTWNQSTNKQIQCKPMTPLHSPPLCLSFGALIVQFHQEMTEINQSLQNSITPPLSSLEASSFNLPPKIYFLELIGPHERGLWSVLHDHRIRQKSGSGSMTRRPCQKNPANLGDI